MNQYKLDDDDKTLANSLKDPKRAMKKVSSNLKKASKAHAKDAETVSKITKDMKRTKNPGYKMNGY
jgi:putative component of toxin-antitoxin plasmid stabilization module